MKIIKLSIRKILGTTAEWLAFGKKEDVTYNLNLPIQKWDDLGNSDSITEKKAQFANNYYCLIVEDDSMTTSDRTAPSFPAGTIILVDPTAEPKINKLVIARHKEKT